MLIANARRWIHSHLWCSRGCVLFHADLTKRYCSCTPTVRLRRCRSQLWALYIQLSGLCESFSMMIIIEFKMRSVQRSSLTRSTSEGATFSWSLKVLFACSYSCSRVLWCDDRASSALRLPNRIPKPSPGLTLVRKALVNLFSSICQGQPKIDLGHTKKKHLWYSVIPSVYYLSLGSVSFAGAYPMKRGDAFTCWWRA